MKFWDSSAIVPLLVPEKSSTWCQSVLSEDPRLFVWFFTITEIHSALHKQERTGRLSPTEQEMAKVRLKTIIEAWTEISPTEAIRTRAHRILDLHNLQAADALQLAAALVAFHERPQNAPFVCLDDRLAMAARKEGFEVLQKSK